MEGEKEGAFHGPDCGTDPGQHPQTADLAGPAPDLAGNILQQLYNTVDAFIIGRFLGGAAFGAVGVAGTVMNLFIFILSGCCTGVAVLFCPVFTAAGTWPLSGGRGFSPWCSACC